MKILEEIEWLPAGKTQLMANGDSFFLVQDIGSTGEALVMQTFTTIDAARHFYVDLVFDLRDHGCEPKE